MIHQQIKELIFSSVEHVVSNISQNAVHPDSDFKRSKKSLPRNIFPFSFHKAHLPPRLKCLISGNWILPCQPLLPSASSAQSLNLRRWKLYSGTLIPLPWNCRPLPLRIRITVSWLPMAPPALFSALRLSHHQTTTVARDTLPTVSTACT